VALVLASSTGGIGQHVASLARGLVAAGATVTVCGPAATGEQFDFTGAGARFAAVEIPASPRPGDVRAVGSLRAALEAARDAGAATAAVGDRSTSGPEVVHAHGLRAGFVCALARTGRPLVVTWHNAALSRGLKAPVHRMLERVVAGAADVTLGASADLVERARAVGARDARLAEVAAPVLPAPRRSRVAVRAEFGAGPATPVILSVGRLHRQKRHDILIDAAANWRDLRPAPVVLIAGAGPSYMDLAARVSELRAPVSLLGHRRDIADLLAAADVAVVTSDWEARQLFAQEALRAGVPLVATAVGGLPDLVGDAAVLVPPGDVEAVEVAVRDLITDEKRRAGYAERGRRRAATWPTEAQTVAQVSAVYAELSAARGPA
jgi:glycosyltransferase involved in cell wall biosynthesis